MPSFRSHKPRHAARRGGFASPGHDHKDCVHEALAAAERQCARSGVKLTEQRRRVLELIWRSHAPVGAYTLLDKLREEGVRAQPPTVYRALDFLAENGLIHRIESLNAYVGCAEPDQHHVGQFLICTGCHSAAELDDAGIGAAIAARTKEIGFAVSRATVEIAGLCPNCRAAAR
ncbi:MAG: transcriptional repressor [Rhodospirillaceae bacterium]|nr:transcriptional repressor [Rhodospirillaceae bacterium]